MRGNRQLMAFVLFVVPAISDGVVRGQSPQAGLQVLAWNIWNGGDGARYAEDESVKRAKQQAIVDVIKASGADVIAIVETYGSGEAIAAGLGFHFHPRGENVSILSRWPIVEDVSVYKPFNPVLATDATPPNCWPLTARVDGKKSPPSCAALTNKWRSGPAFP